MNFEQNALYNEYEDQREYQQYCDVDQVLFQNDEQNFGSNGENISVNQSEDESGFKQQIIDLNDDNQQIGEHLFEEDENDYAEEEISLPTINHGSGQDPKDPHGGRTHQLSTMQEQLN